MNRKNKIRYKKKQICSWIGIGALISVIVYTVFSISFDKIHQMLLEKDITQITLTSNFVTKLIETEIENRISALEVSQKIFLEKNELAEEEVVEKLKNLRTELGFEKIGISDLEGNAVDDDGTKSKFKDTAFLETISENEEYISDVVDESDTILLAVPIQQGNEPKGILWGYYLVENIAEKIDLNNDSHRYFQLIDDSGRYISDSNNINSFAKDCNVWREMTRYELTDGVTIEEIRENVKNGRCGQFHFRYKGQGRYVSYEPLGINNWYVFSVLTEEYVTDYVMEIEKIFSILLWGLLTCIAIVVAIIGRSIYRKTILIKDQNSRLASKNSLLFMVLKHTNDIPFEVNLNDRTLTVYRIKGTEQTVVRSIDDYTPDNMLKRGLINEEYYETYRQMFEDMINLKECEHPVVKVKVDGEWDANKVHYNIVDQEQIVGFLEDYNEQAYQYEQMQEINKKIQLDSLTALYSRSHFKYEVEQAIKKSREAEGSELSALLILDLDFFKQANDTMGHLVGDQILKESAMAIKSVVGNTDICGRLGGDEFVLFIQNAKDMNAIRRCAEKINDALHRTYSRDDKSVTISASIGAAVLTTETKFDELYQLADTALYKVKENGRNDCCILSGETGEENRKDTSYRQK